MPHDEPAVSDEDPTIRENPTQSTAVQARTDAYAPIEDEEWLEESQELPRRPRRRLLTPIPLALLGVLLIACGFIGGALVEKGQTSSSSSAGSVGSAASLASRFAALRGGSGRAGASGTSSNGSSSSGSGFARPTAGTVAYLAANTLYVTNSEGNTVKVTTSPGTSVTKTVKTTLKGIHPGETVTVTGATRSGGAVSAESIIVGSGAGGGLGALFSGSGARAGSSRGAGRTSSEPALFGNGG